MESFVVETVSVFDPAAGLVTPLITTLTASPPPIDRPVNRLHVATCPFVPQLPITVVDEAVVSKTWELKIELRPVPDGKVMLILSPADADSPPTPDVLNVIT